MSRVKISEYRAKKILLGEGYGGMQLRSEEKMVFPKGHWVAKVDQGVKKRYKQGLLTVDASATEMQRAVKEWEKKGFSQFLLEPLVSHERQDEQYLSLERIREGVRILHAKDGGVDIEEHPEAVQAYVIKNASDIERISKESGVPKEFLAHVYQAFDTSFFAFMEINPLVVHDGQAHVLDAAVLVDSAGEFFTKNWSEDDVVKAHSKHRSETVIEALAATTPASLKLTVMNPDGALFFLLSGGGGSIVIADEAELEGAGNLMGNYGEYSGGPTREETYLYAKEVIALMLASRAKKKALVIAGGVANFTDVEKTFLGIIDALKESGGQLREHNVKVFVRRGGPNEETGLMLMKDFLEKERVLGSVHGSKEVITKAIEEAIAYIRI
ncbi:MAG: ATP citrate lyase citrate-binding domain-containing protein [Candidatus Paceibacterota bacterium]